MFRMVKMTVKPVKNAPCAHIRVDSQNSQLTDFDHYSYLPLKFSYRAGGLKYSSIEIFTSKFQRRVELEELEENHSRSQDFRAVSVNMHLVPTALSPWDRMISIFKNMQIRWYRYVVCAAVGRPRQGHPINFIVISFISKISLNIYILCFLKIIFNLFLLIFSNEVHVDFER